MNSSSFTLSESDQEHLLEKLDVFKVNGRDKRGRKVVLIVGKNFPGKKTLDACSIFVSFWIQDVCFLCFLVNLVSLFD